MIKRFKYLVNPEFQLRFVGFMLVIAVICLGIVYASNLVFIQRLHAIGAEIGLDSGHPFHLFIAQQRRMMDTTFVFCGIGVLLTIVIGGLYLSHRVAGPIQRIDSYVEGVLNQTEHGELQFRKRDYFHELAEHINSLVRAYRKDT